MRLLVSSGILQPYTLQNEIFTISASTNWLATEIIGYPVPTQNTLLVDIKIAESGRMNLQLMSGFGKVLFSRTFDYSITNGAQQIDLSAFPPGMYYLNATLSIPPAYIKIRSGSFKVIKM